LKIVLLLFLSILYLCADNLEITSNDFYFKDASKIARFSGNVVAKNGKNSIKADKILVYLDENSEANKYVAIGNVKFEIKDDKKDIVGSCKKLTYLPEESKYILEQNVKMHDILNKRDVYGDEIVIDNKNKTSYAKSKGKKPVKFIFKVKSKK